MMSTQQAPISATPAPFQSASLYVGDLHNEVTESLLFELFNRVGPVASIRVCRDSVTRRSLGYAYVNFHNVQDAERALDTMNFTDIKSKPCRIMWSQRDPSLRKSGVGNVFVRNLAPSVDNKGLYDTFSVFGNILSCKVATDDQGVSKGYGYVHFETAEAAQDAIQKFNGTLIDDVEVHVGSFVKRQDRAGQNDWTNLYVKHFPLTWDEAKIKEIFSAYGNVANVAIQRDLDGKSKAFGFVSFADHESAVKALADLGGKVFTLPAVAPEEPVVTEDENGEPVVPAPQTFELYVSRAQKKSERNREMKQRVDMANQEKLSRYQGMNLYVKNISDNTSDDQFRESFAAFGTITSARIMRDSTDLKTSKGFGFVCYSSPEEATRAVTEMNGKLLGSKPLVVTLHQRKEHRRAHLAATYAPQNMNMGMRFQQGMGMGMNPAMGMPQPYMYMPQGPQGGQQGFNPNQQRGGPGMGPGMGPGGSFPYGPMGGNAGGRGGGPNSPRNMFPGGPGAPGGRPFYGGGAPPNYYPQGLPQGQGPPQMGGTPQQQGPGQGQPNGGFKGRGAGPMGGAPSGGYPVSGGMSPTQQSQQQQGLMGQGRRPMPGAPGQGPVGGPQQPPMGVNRGQQQGPPQVMGGMAQRGVYQGPTMAQQQAPQQGRQVPGTGMGVKFNNQARNQNGPLPMQQPNMGMGLMPQQQMMMQQAPAKLDFSDAALASADPLTQKNMIGERLYPLIHHHQPDQAGKITGMLLEMDNGELLNLIESPEALLSKIDEALAVLRNHKIGSDE